MKADQLEQDQRRIKTLQEQNKAQLEEIKSLYRRMHIELPPERRAGLIVELFQDPRTELRLLGFELADRDLSASIDLGDDVGQSVHRLLSDPNPMIRARAARLVTRLVPPDAMIVITEALNKETDPSAAEPMLLGIARWPNADAVPAVKRWLQRDDAPLFACFSAAWAIEGEGLWNPQSDYPELLCRLRSAGPQQLREDGMKLLAKIGSSDDLRRLIGFMLSSDPGVVRWSAAALVETPRAVDVLVQAASENEVLYQAAAESLIKHRATPEGLRRLAMIPVSDQQLRRDMLERMGKEIEIDRLGEAVRLAQLDPETTIAILSRLVSSEQPHSARSAKGVLLLAELQLNEGRPNRVTETLLTLEDAPLEPVDQIRVNELKTKALLLLNRFDETAAISMAFDVWFDAIRLASDPEQRTRIAQQFVERAGDTLTEDQLSKLQPYLKADSTPSDQGPGDG